MIDNCSLARWAGMIAATTIITAGLLSSGAANADTFIPLPDQETVQPLPDGSVLKVRLVGQSTTISPSMGATPLHRNAWVSASAQFELDNGTALGGWITPGYIVGCQVDINGGGVNGNASGVQTGNSTSVSAGAGATLSLGPGQTQTFYLLDLEQKNGFGDDSHQPVNVFQGNNASVSWTNTTIQLAGCAGYAQARAFVQIDIDTPSTHGTVTAWGQPFSLG